MNQDKEVKAFLPIDWNGEGLATIESKFKGNYMYHEEHLGDHSELFIVEYNEKGEKAALWDVRDISYISLK